MEDILNIERPTEETVANRSKMFTFYLPKKRHMTKYCNKAIWEEKTTSSTMTCTEGRYSDDDFGAVGAGFESQVKHGYLCCNPSLLCEVYLTLLSTRGLLATDLVSLNPGLVTRTTPKLASSNYHTNGRMSTDFTCIAPLSLSAIGLELLTRQPRSDTWTTRLPQPHISCTKTLEICRNEQ
ncbi:hypothetical protein TNCV_3387941 [Trichonephila clavipes]|nr:hypothetical protein TNCV_3387941 [Trichonephila clavipes]